MGWISELSDLMSKYKIVKYSVSIFFLACAVSVVVLAFRLGRDTYKGNDGVEAGPFKLPEHPAQSVSKTDSGKNSSTITQQQPAFTTTSKPVVIIQKERQSKSQQPNTQLIDSGGSGIQNNAPIQNSKQAGRDLHDNSSNGVIRKDTYNNTYINQRMRLSEGYKPILLYKVDSIIQQYGYKKDVGISYVKVSDLESVVEDIKQTLYESGYHIVGETSCEGCEYKGITYKPRTFLGYRYVDIMIGPI